MLASITVIWESPIGDFRVVQRSDTTYFYPQVLECGTLQEHAWHYLYGGSGSKEDERISEPSPILAMRYEQCVNGCSHVESGAVLEEMIRLHKEKGGVV
jgi:hypothetical protein